MSEVRSCIKCGVAAPDTNGEITSMSKRGWRVTRANEPDGTVAVTWHCPACWAAHKSSLSPKKLF